MDPNDQILPDLELILPTSYRKQNKIINERIKLKIKLLNFFVIHSTSSHRFVVAHSTQAANEAVDHLTDTEHRLQNAGYHQSDEQAYVELHHVGRFFAFAPHAGVSQVGLAVVPKKGLMNEHNFTIIISVMWDFLLSHLFLKGVVHLKLLRQTGPLAKPASATAKLYAAPATPTAANIIDKNICQREITTKDQKGFHWHLTAL